VQAVEKIFRSVSLLRVVQRRQRLTQAYVALFMNTINKMVSREKIVAVVLSLSKV
jgi:hypothetical protein